MDLTFKIKKFIKDNNLIEPGDNLLVAVSGGIDSMTLLKILDMIKDDIGFLISVAHINHKLRGKDSDKDERFVSDSCKEIDIPFFSVSWSGPEKGENTQEAARDFRYGSFLKICSKIGANKVALAHNMDDQAETVILNLIRGAGLDGICGMHFCSGINDNVALIRPLINIGRDEIEAFAEQNKINFREDVTNDQVKYRRNFIRHKIMPLIHEINPNSSERIAKMSRSLQEDEAFIRKMADQKFDRLILSKEKNSLILDGKKIKEIDLPVRRRIIKLAYIEINKSAAGINRDQIIKIDEIITGFKKSGEYKLPHGIAFGMNSGRLVFSKN